MSTLDKAYWDNRYKNEDTGWDLGDVSPALKTYIDKIASKDLKILVPGAGNGYELAYLHANGFTHSYLIDLSPTAIANFKQANPTIDEKYLLEGDFFELDGQFDLILEQTFFCAIDRRLRQAYAQKVHELLSSSGKLVGLLWKEEFGSDFPPFGGTKQEYISYFDKLFELITLEDCYNSIKPRAGRELFLIAQKLT